MTNSRTTQNRVKLLLFFLPRQSFGSCRLNCLFDKFNSCPVYFFFFPRSQQSPGSDSNLSSYASTEDRTQTSTNDGSSRSKQSQTSQRNSFASCKTKGRAAYRVGCHGRSKTSQVGIPLKQPVPGCERGHSKRDPGNFKIRKFSPVMKRVCGRIDYGIVVKRRIYINIIKVADLVGQVSIHDYWVVKFIKVLMHACGIDQALNLKRMTINQEIKAFLIGSFRKRNVVPGGFEVLCNNTFSDVSLEVAD